MKVNILTCIFSLMFCFANRLAAQQKKLNIGDDMPNVSIPHMLNFKVSTTNISDFKGKLLILDFWGTWCSPCVANIPKMDSLQSEFRDKVQFLPITDETFERVSSFAAHFFKSQHIKIMTAYNDRTVRKLFDYGALPYYIWINANGKIIAKTSQAEITAANITKALEDNISGLKMRTDEKHISLESNRPIFNLHYNQILDDQTTSQVVLNRGILEGQSIATQYIHGLKSINKFDTTHYYSANVSISNLYSNLYVLLYYGKINLGIGADKRIRYEIKDTAKLDKIRNNSWGEEYRDFLIKNGKCYEFVWPKMFNHDSLQVKFQWIKADLDKYFGIPIGINVVLEKRLLDECLVLEKIGSIKLLRNTRSKTEESYDRYNYKLSNGNFSRFFNRLGGYYFQMSEMPIIDESGITGNVDLELKCDMTNLKEVNKALEKYGLKLKIKPAIADILVFKDR
ncbi:TlpA disulfide reductase family protein [Pedobacter sp. UYP1]|uniref:TlpA family protein disulfide reductase n=1 Tax=Pedobacter sp. UYP1 TaxID=1756396 RepID=UPI00339989B0